MIIGVVGPLGAGKSSIVEYLENKGFAFYRLSDVIREKSGRGHLDRESLQNLGNELRKKYGLGILAKEVWKKIKFKNERIVIDGLRNPGEVSFFRKKNYFYLVSVIADKDIRFQRLKKRASVRDPKTKKEFLDNENRDLKDKERFGQQTKDTMKFADFEIINNGSILQLYQKIDSVLKSIHEL
ncbi:AAA family ATPase [Patescibacteria group bacterium]|nr:AAA family ATPase [Patescibacteria group bacterium]